MKKLIAFMLCCMMMVGALSAFANDGVMPIAECPCTRTYDKHIGTRTEGCTVIKTYRVICRECSANLGEYEVETTNHRWEEEIIDGKTEQVCYYCGAIK